MVQFQKEDLLGKYYWESGEEAESVLENYSSKITLDKNNGYEILHFCREFTELYNILPLAANIRHIERCLQLPEVKNINSKLLLMRTIRTNWYTYLARQFNTGITAPAYTVQAG